MKQISLSILSLLICCTASADVRKLVTDYSNLDIDGTYVIVCNRNDTKPSMQIVEVQNETVLAGSIEGKLGNSYDPNEESYGRGGRGDDDWE